MKLLVELILKGNTLALTLWEILKTIFILFVLPSTFLCEFDLDDSLQSPITMGINLFE